MVINVKLLKKNNYSIYIYIPDCESKLNNLIEVLKTIILTEQENIILTEQENIIEENRREYKKIF